MAPFVTIITSKRLGIYGEVGIYCVEIGKDVVEGMGEPTEDQDCVEKINEKEQVEQHFSFFFKILWVFKI